MALHRWGEGMTARWIAFAILAMFALWGPASGYWWHQGYSTVVERDSVLLAEDWDRTIAYRRDGGPERLDVRGLTAQPLTDELKDRPVLVLDAGANVDCAAEELVGFAHLGQIYARDAWGRPDPVVALLNIGEEEEKGNAAAKEAHRLLATSGLRFIGNIEGRDVVMARCDRGPFDVVVCDGFVGNVLLKFYESIQHLIRGIAEREVGTEFMTLDSVRKVFMGLDYAVYGGAPLLGVQGVSIIAHGASSPQAFRSAVRVAVEAARHHFIQHLNSEFAAGSAAT